MCAFSTVALTRCAAQPASTTRFPNTDHAVVLPDSGQHLERGADIDTLECLAQDVGGAALVPGRQELPEEADCDRPTPASRKRSAAASTFASSSGYVRCLPCRPARSRSTAAGEAPAPAGADRGTRTFLPATEPGSRAFTVHFMSSLSTGMMVNTLALH
jgi:hypothetical protein